MSLLTLNEEVINCKKCIRLREWCTTRHGTNPYYIDQTYWGLPVPSFGDGNGRVLIVGLAPGTHGANRTGRIFTGDTAGDLLYKSLYKHGFSSSEISRKKDDGLILNDVYITNVVKCAPPKNMPTPNEFATCKRFLAREIRTLVNLQVILVLGEKAFDNIKSIMAEKGVNTRGAKFEHGKVFRFTNSDIVVIASYHTSKYNIDTKRMTVEKLDNVFLNIKRVLNSNV